MINLDVTPGTLLKIINGNTLRPNNSSHVHLSTWNDFSFYASNANASRSILLGAMNAVSLLIVVTTVAGGWSISSSTVHSSSHSCCISSHTLSLIRQGRIRWSTSPFCATTQFIFNQHLKSLHRINCRVDRQEVDHLFRFCN